MPTALAILAGLGQGLGKFPEGLVTGLKLEQERLREEQEERRAQEAERRAIEALGLGRERLGIQREQLAAQEAARFVDHPTLGKVPKEMLPYLLPRAETPRPPEPFTLGEGQQRFGPKGEVIATGFPKAPKEPGAPERREARIAEALANAGWAPTMPGYAQAYLNVERQVSVPGAGAFGQGQFVVPPPAAIPPAKLGRQAAPAPIIEAPVTPEEAGAAGVPLGTPRSALAGRTALTAAQRTKLDAQNASLGLVTKMERDIQGFDFPRGPLERVRAIPKTAYKVYGQADPKLVAIHRRVEGTLALIVRSLGEVGTLTDGDIERARALMPTFAPIPDTAGVIQEKLAGLRDLIREVTSRVGTRPQ